MKTTRRADGLRAGPWRGGPPGPALPRPSPGRVVASPSVHPRRRPAPLPARVGRDHARCPFADGLESPSSSPATAPAAGRCSWSSRPAASGSSRRTARSDRRRSSTSATAISAGGEQGLLGLAFHPDYADERPLLRRLHPDPDGATVDQRVPRAPTASADRGLRARSCCRSPSRSRTTTAACSRSTPTAMLLHRHGRRRQRRRPARQRPEPRRAAGQDAAHRRRRPASRTPSPPTTRSSARTDTRPEIWALGMRNPWRFSVDRVDRRRVHRRRRARATGRRSTSSRPARRPELRLEHHRGPGLLRRRRPATATA